ncbi:MAG: oligoendopeptidase F [Clostridia bacterium]|nr:oligoendopeptidase F [Clostridia bacterium]
MNMERGDAPARYRWDLTAIYATEEEFMADCRRAEEATAALGAMKDTLTASAEALLDGLCRATAAERVLEKLYEYAMLSSDLDKGDNGAEARLARVTDLLDAHRAATYFVAPAVQAIDEGVLEGFYRDAPALAAYRRTLTLIRREIPHMLTGEGEKLLAELSPVFGSQKRTHAVFANADLSFGTVKGEGGETVPLTSATYVPLLMSSDRRVRRSAFRTLYKTYRQFGNTFASLLASRVKEKVTLSKLRRFPDSLTASVFADEVTPEVYMTLIKTVREGLLPLFDYYDLKREVLGLSHLHLYDVYAPLSGEAAGSYTYDEAVKEVLAAVRILGEDYHSTLKDGLTKRGWVDVYPGRGKRSGAYSAGAYDTEPYMLLNFMGKLDDVSTLAHEAGHSMHTHYANSANPPQDASYTIFVAEVASTVNELLFTRRRLRLAESTEERLALLNQLMETYKGTLYRQTMFAEFELKMHRLCEAGEPLTQEVLCREYYALVKDYFGPRVTVDEDIAMEWMRIPHFYNCFYVYKYATCISAASAIVKRLETEGEEYLAHYLDFLRAGGSRSPLESLKLAGIDMTDPAVIRAAIDDFAEAVAEFRRLYREARDEK